MGNLKNCRGNEIHGAKKYTGAYNSWSNSNSNTTDQNYRSGIMSQFTAKFTGGNYSLTASPESYFGFIQSGTSSGFV
jgi:hypothetical protein